MSETPEPEPVDAEFEPASESVPPGSGDKGRSGIGQGAALVLFFAAAVTGGVLGYAGARLFPGPPAAQTVLTDALEEARTRIEGLETRLSAIEAEAPPAGPDLAPILDRLDSLESRPVAGDGSDPVDLGPVLARLDAVEATLQSRPAPSGADESAVAALTARIANLETALDAAQIRFDEALAGLAGSATGEGDGVSAEAVSQILASQTALQDRIARLETRLSSTAEPVDHGPEVADLQTRFALVEAELAALDTRTRDALNAARQADRAAGEAAESARSQGGTDAARSLAARALAFTALREAATGDQAFEAERAALARLWRGRAELADLARHSRAGAPTLAALADAYPSDAINEAAGPGRVFFGLIQVRRVEAEASETGPLAITALAEARLAAGDLAGAVEFTERLDGAALDAARPWLLSARARLDIAAALRSLQAALTEEAAAEGADPT